MEIWEKRAICEVEAAVANNSLMLQDSLPEFLKQIEDALSTKIDRTHIRIKWDKKESTRIGKKHGSERAANIDYTMDQLIFEYHILRQVICEVLEEVSPITDTEREIIICAVEQAVNDAATEFSDTLNKLQEKFTYTLAHDLLTPITSAKLGLQIVMKKLESNNTLQSATQKIINSMDRLDLMINDLLDAGRLKAGKKLQMSFEKIDINNILSESIDELNFLHESRVNYKSEGPMVGNFNESGIKRIVDNLITNALKYSTPNTPIKIELKKIDKSILISVHNFGPPIAELNMQNLFNQFHRSNTAEGTKGWGLGLSVVKGITEAHHGHVDVQSSISEGTTFNIFLPIE
jgi:signal transduction histidine kinase